jgi:single-stranded-DNA-specific exonuclease
MFFNGGERQLPDPPWDIAFTIDRNTFRGVTSLQVVITDVRAARPDVS